jgi:hypothetical protein
MNHKKIDVLGTLLACDSSSRKTLPEDAFWSVSQELVRGNVTGILIIGNHIEGMPGQARLLRYHLASNRWSLTRIWLPKEYMEKPWIGASLTLTKEGAALICSATDKVQDEMAFICHIEFMQPSGPIRSVMFEDLPEGDAIEYAARSNASLVTLHDGTILRLGGRVRPEMYGGDQPLAHNAIYDPSKKAFEMPRFTNQLSDILGRRQSFPQGEWSSLDFRTDLPWGMFCITLPDNNVLITGGIHTRPSGEHTRDACFIYYTSSKKIVRVKEMTSPRAFHSGCMLPNGRVFVCGGVRASLQKALTCEEYDPATGEWTQLSATLIPRIGHSCVLMVSGEVLILGGWDVEQRCELYNPLSGGVRETSQIPVKTSGFQVIPIGE